MASDKISFRPRKTVQPPPKFIQITATAVADSYDVLYALDVQGDVWQLTNGPNHGRWTRLSMQREEG